MAFWIWSSLKMKYKKTRKVLDLVLWALGIIALMLLMYGIIKFLIK